MAIKPRMSREERTQIAREMADMLLLDGAAREAFLMMHFFDSDAALLGYLAALEHIVHAIAERDGVTAH
jgi:hypothetical protein